LRQSGTYWYHSHTGLQEQRGLYGAIVIATKVQERIQTDRDEVLVLSDWTNESPTNVMRTLMRGSDWYSIRKGTAQSVFGAAQAGLLKEYFDREKHACLPWTFPTWLTMPFSSMAYAAGNWPQSPGNASACA
jgi:FtsP/CotA-like multicopper oxidase with cupredoxin domain